MVARVALGSPRTQSSDERTREVRRMRSTCEVPEQGHRARRADLWRSLHGHEGGNAGDRQGEASGRGNRSPTVGGGDGGKAPDQGEPAKANHAPDTEPGSHATRAGAGPSSSEEAEGMAAHGAPTPHLLGRSTPRGILAPPANRRSGGRRPDVAAVWRGLGG